MIGGSEDDDSAGEDVIKQFYDNEEKVNIARQVLKTMRINQAVSDNPKTRYRIKTWLGADAYDLSKATDVIRDLAREDQFPVDKRGSWRRGTSAMDGLYITDHQRAKELGNGQTDWENI